MPLTQPQAPDQFTSLESISPLAWKDGASEAGSDADKFPDLADGDAWADTLLRATIMPSPSPLSDSSTEPKNERAEFQSSSSADPSNGSSSEPVPQDTDSFIVPGWGRPVDSSSASRGAALTRWCSENPGANGSEAIKYFMALQVQHLSRQLNQATGQFLSSFHPYSLNSSSSFQLSAPAAESPVVVSAPAAQASSASASSKASPVKRAKRARDFRTEAEIKADVLKDFSNPRWTYTYQEMADRNGATLKQVKEWTTKAKPPKKQQSSKKTKPQTPNPFSDDESAARRSPRLSSPFVIEHSTAKLKKPKTSADNPYKKLYPYNNNRKLESGT
jgi:hypothetical protein